jgi:hypothetical protein
MKNYQLLLALQTEIQKHNLSTFMDEKDKVVITGCTLCRKRFGTVEQFKFHITDDVLPQLLDKLSVCNDQCQGDDSRAQQHQCVGLWCGHRCYRSRGEGAVYISAHAKATS